MMTDSSINAASMQHHPDGALVGRALTVKQPQADLIMAGIKPVENRTWPVPSTLPQWGECDYHGRIAPDELDQDDDHGTWRHWPDEYQCPVDLDGPFPFRLWIHAGKEFDWSALDPGSLVTRGSYRLDSDARGVLLGHVTVTGCHHADDCYDRDPCPTLGCTFDDHESERWCSPWAQPDCWHWELADPVLLDEPIPMRGRQRLWRLPEDIERQVAA